MKNFKSLMLGSAAGVLAVAGAQAADLPVKAKPVEYVKVCSAYGAGFYYIPGTDICLRVGGFIFSDVAVNNYQDAGYAAVVGTQRDRADDWVSYRIRTDMIFDARTNTEYGTLRSYLSTGFMWDTAQSGAPDRQGSSTTTAPSWSWYFDRAFIQFAGMTFGIAQSFFDFDPGMVYLTTATKSGKYAPMIAYTAQFGNGVSASLSMEDAVTRRQGIDTVSYAGSALNALQVMSQNNYASEFLPDFIANLRIDQGWGDAQFSAALQQVKSTNAGTTTIGRFGPEKYGYAFLGGLNFKLPQLGAGDNFQVEGVWSKGATGFTGVDASPYSTGSSGQGGLAYVTHAGGPLLETFDAFETAGPTGKTSLATAWSANAQLRHFWTPTLRSTFMYGIVNFNAPTAAQLSGYPDGKLQQAVANLIWSPVKNLDIGTEVYWADLKTTGGFTGGGSAGGNASESWWGGNFRVTRYW